MVKSPQQFEYIIDEVTYETEDAAHSSNDGTCVGGGHDWKKSYSYGRYSCRNCDTVRMKVKS